MTPFAWRSLLDLAERLLVYDPDDAVIRTVINRAYYAAFNVARDIVEQSEQVPNLRAHNRVWRWFARHESGPPMERLGQIGFRLSNLRRQADYEAEAMLTVADAQHAMREARHLVDSLSRIQ